MAKETYKNVRKSRFTQVSNKVLWDKNLSLEAKGLLSIFLSNSDGWELNMKEIISRSKNGRDKHYKVVDELIKYGYFARVEIRKGGKFLEMVYIFSDDTDDVIEELEEYKKIEGAILNPDKKKNKEKEPFPENQDTVDSPLPENPDTVNPNTEKPDTENQDINNKTPNNTKHNNTNSNNINQSISLVINELYEQQGIPIPILQVMNKNIDRLTKDNIHPISIKVFYETFTEHQLSDSDFAYVLEKVLTQTKGKINNFHAVMKKAAQNFFNEYE